MTSIKEKREFQYKFIVQNIGKVKTLEQIVEDVATNDFPDSDHIYTNLRDLLLEEGEGREHEQKEERLAYAVKILEKLQENGSDITAETNVNTVEKLEVVRRALRQLLDQTETTEIIKNASGERYDEYIEMEIHDDTDYVYYSCVDDHISRIIYVLKTQKLKVKVLSGDIEIFKKIRPEDPGLPEELATKIAELDPRFSERFGKIVAPYKKHIDRINNKGTYFNTRFGVQKLRDDVRGLYLKNRLTDKRLYLHYWNNKD